MLHVKAQMSLFFPTDADEDQQSEFTTSPTGKYTSFDGPGIPDVTSLGTSTILVGVPVCSTSGVQAFSVPRVILCTDRFLLRLVDEGC